MVLNHSPRFKVPLFRSFGPISFHEGFWKEAERVKWRGVQRRISQSGFHVVPNTEVCPKRGFGKFWGFPPPFGLGCEGKPFFRGGTFPAAPRVFWGGAHPSFWRVPTLLFFLKKKPPLGDSLEICGGGPQKSVGARGGNSIFFVCWREEKHSYQPTRGCFVRTADQHTIPQEISPCGRK